MTEGKEAFAQAPKPERFAIEIQGLKEVLRDAKQKIDLITPRLAVDAIGTRNDNSKERDLWIARGKAITDPGNALIALYESMQSEEQLTLEQKVEISFLQNNFLMGLKAFELAYDAKRTKRKAQNVSHKK